MRDVLEILAHVVLAGMVLLHPLVALGVIALVVLVVFAMLFYLLGEPPDMNDHSS